MANVLGLSFFYHDSAAALVRDGRVVAAAAEERFCRRKHTSEFPKRAIEYCLEAGSLRTINDLDAIVFYEKPVMKLHRIVESLAAVWPRGLSAFARQVPAFLSAKFNVLRQVEKSLPGYRGQVLFAEHHRSHAASAFYCSPFDDAAILTMDGVGEWETTTIGAGHGQRVKLERAIRFPHSIGLLYSALTGYLGFRVNDGEWKVMGLAPYGEPRYVDRFRQLVRMHDDGSFQLDMRYFVHHHYGRWIAHNERWQELFGFPRRQPGGDLEQVHQDLARSGQVVVEELILNLAREARRSTGCSNLVIAGGVGLNSVANGRIEEAGLFDGVWIQPAPGDDGAALGAALLVSQEVFEDDPSPELTDVYLGPEFSDGEVSSILEGNEIPYVSLDDAALCDAVAGLVAEGKVVGWFQGRMEFGPRALGARSILADATNPRMKEIINEKVKFREYFRPFAPSVPQERVHEFFEVEPGTELPFMLKVTPVRPEMRERIPAVTHADGTGRVQTVREDRNPLFHRLLAAVERRTGVPVLLNTSFNVRGEPIVCTPKDAVECFFNSGIDVLVMGRCLVTEKPREPDQSEGFEHSDALEFGDVADASDGMLPPLVSQRFTMAATAVTVPTAPATLAEAPHIESSSETTRKVLNFYRELPFNYYSNAVDTAAELMRSNRVSDYAVVHAHLKERRGARLLDVGCGAGWFVNSCAHYYGVAATGLDLNPVVLKQARSVARLMPGCESNEFIEGSVFEFEPDRPFDVVNSLGVLHSTPDCHGAIRRVLDWVAPDGYFHLGLYHLYGRRPFLQHFADMQAAGATNEELYAEYKRVHHEVKDETHLLSWFRDQVLHPHETQHTYEEMEALLRSEGFVVEGTSINGFKPMPSREALIEMEKRCEAISKTAIERRKRYYPGFFSVWARRAH
jgi:carbamoyltransferase